ncbi:MAG: hypothetical protein V3T70_05665 [Phycisphaerae bacterium]
MKLPSFETANRRLAVAAAVLALAGVYVTSLAARDASELRRAVRSITVRVTPVFGQQDAASLMLTAGAAGLALLLWCGLHARIPQATPISPATAIPPCFSDRLDDRGAWIRHVRRGGRFGP